jgi:hypothetical protein
VIDSATLCNGYMSKPTFLNESIIDVSTNDKLVQNQENPQSQVDVDFLGVQ